MQSSQAQHQTRHQAHIPTALGPASPSAQSAREAAAHLPHTPASAAGRVLIRVVEPGELESRREDLDEVLLDPETRQARRASDPPLPAYWMAGFIEVSALDNRLDDARPFTAWDRPMTSGDRALPWWVRIRLPWWRRGRYPTRWQLFTLAAEVADVSGVAALWLHRENLRFGGRTPWALYEAGDGWRVVELLLWLREKP